MPGGATALPTPPAALDFAAALAKVPQRIHHGLYADETAEYCNWHMPAAHELESWGDALAFDGTASLTQPLIEPLYGGKSLHEMMAALLGRGDVSGYDLVRAPWNGHPPAGDFQPPCPKPLPPPPLPAAPAAHPA